jgi:hypothetical protein
MFFQWFYALFLPLLVLAVSLEIAPFPFTDSFNRSFKQLFEHIFLVSQPRTGGLMPYEFRQQIGMTLAEDPGVGVSLDLFIF